uniref:Uncharacterized protein n=1 Tax=Ananas comosus var. bracteatus TaxID=296719 RepID=A0A6V7PLA3_ANACO|nr:unnamed protein product [Ananas comosus var. bracteatus]
MTLTDLGFDARFSRKKGLLDLHIYICVVFGKLESGWFRRKSATRSDREFDVPIMLNTLAQSPPPSLSESNLGDPHPRVPSPGRAWTSGDLPRRLPPSPHAPVAAVPARPRRHLDSSRSPRTSSIHHSGSPWLRSPDLRQTPPVGRRRPERGSRAICSLRPSWACVGRGELALFPPRCRRTEPHPWHLSGLRRSLSAAPRRPSRCRSRRGTPEPELCLCEQGLLLHHHRRLPPSTIKSTGFPWSAGPDCRRRFRCRSPRLAGDELFSLFMLVARALSHITVAAIAVVTCSITVPFPSDIIVTVFVISTYDFDDLFLPGSTQDSSACAAPNGPVVVYTPHGNPLRHPIPHGRATVALLPHVQLPEGPPMPNEGGPKVKYPLAANNTKTASKCLYMSLYGSILAKLNF